MAVKWGLNFLSLFLPNYESYSIEILYEGSPCITLGHGAICGALGAYNLEILTQIGWEMGFRLFELFELVSLKLRQRNFVWR